MTITHLFFDIGGVLGTNGWDHEQRNEAFARFGIDQTDFEDRHREMVASLETGRASLDEYLAETLFYKPRPFTVQEFKAFIVSLSQADAETVGLARELSRTGRWTMATLNNESEDLNRHRIQAFGLTGIFTAFFTSCWLGCTKPARRIYDLALAMSQADPARSVFVDDRDRNLQPARALGMQAVLFTDAKQLRLDLGKLGVSS